MPCTNFEQLHHALQLLQCFLLYMRLHANLARACLPRRKSLATLIMSTVTCVGFWRIDEV